VLPSARQLGRLLVVALTASIFWPAGLRAQGSVRDAAAARSLFREGVACADRQEWDCATDRFHRAHGLRPSPVIAYNLGNALISMGRLVEGAEMLEQVARDDETASGMRNDARRAAEAARARTGQVTITAEGMTADVALSIDGHPFSSALLGAAAPADPGAHRIEARRGEEIVARAEFTVSAGGQAIAEITIPPPPRPPVDTLARVSLDPPDERRIEQVIVQTPGPAPAARSDDGPWIALGVIAGLLVIGGGVTAGVVLLQPSEPSSFSGSLGPAVEIR
jgi:hypothetical protein